MIVRCPGAGHTMKEETLLSTLRSVGAVLLATIILVALAGPVMADSVSAGSSIDARVTSVTTKLEARILSADPSAPVSLTYEIAATGVTLPDGTVTPMAGSVSAFLRADIHQSSGNIGYSETSSASGLINIFKKSIRYQGGSNLI
jgi:hypothetical protein